MGNYIRFTNEEPRPLLIMETVVEDAGAETTTNMDAICRRLVDAGCPGLALLHSDAVEYRKDTAYDQLAL